MKMLEVYLIFLINLFRALWHGRYDNVSHANRRKKYGRGELKIKGIFSSISAQAHI